ncbi:tRNA (uridine(54)-C5)-methyltransferase TrmA [Utexia brackfieldae]|uniref:tRNA (uridine(54)-C5)-methyltransferase TrmA n=1 Tax=Utexia brackfieldae TaxID=3074108 RepID=UPI00370D8EA5
MTIEFSQTAYQSQFTAKINRLTTLMAEFAPPPVQAFASPISHYRMRAEFRIWHEGDDLYHIMFDSQTKQRIKITEFPVASQLINQAMTLLLAYIKPIKILRHKLFQVDYLSTLSGQLLISLLYHKKLDDHWAAHIDPLKAYFSRQGIAVEIVGRATKQKRAFEHDYIEETLVVNQQPIIYRQVENSFTQPNAAINIKMLEWALSVTQDAQGDLLELYCGNGNFSLALARNFKQVLATEISKSSVESAQYNIAVNRIENVTILRMSAEEFTQAIRGERSFNRLKGVDLSAYQCQTVLVDPPRAGLDAETLAMISQYPKILYISCNPMTLKENMQTLSQTHRISHLAMFDQFPYTEHMESAVVLNKI